MEKIEQALKHIKINQYKLKSIEARKRILSSLKAEVIRHTDQILDALKKDLGKSAFESYLGEIDFVVHEIDVALKNLTNWIRPKKVGSSLAFFPVKSYIYSEPYGQVLIIGPWNYPFQLVVAPLVGALAAGNTAVIKPSEISHNTSEVLSKIFAGALGEFVACVTGGVEETTYLLEQKFDYIFYTGNGSVGKIVMQKAANHLTPVTLELGGKSPCFVFTKNLDLSAKRIMWGKYFNVGQTCVAPDYILIEEGLVNSFVEASKKWLKHFYGEDLRSSPDYGRIINERHFKRLESYLEGQEILFSGTNNKSELFFAPTFVSAKTTSQLMKEEIFGPILPILIVKSMSEAIEYVNANDKPLACYGFFDEDIAKEQLIQNVSAGGMVINDTLVHLSNENLPFGGVGPSGMGAYHGKYSFDLFSHKKSVMKRSFLFENDLRYPPYTKKLNFIRKLMKLIS